jgi:hypothetical protein
MTLSLERIQHVARQTGFNMATVQADALRMLLPTVQPNIVDEAGSEPSS